EAEGQVQGYSGIFLKVPRGGKHLSQKPKFRPWSGLGVGWGEVMNLALAERFRGQGWGRALLEALLAEARNVGVARVDLMVAVDATAAAGLYRSVGFKPVGLVRGYYQPSGRDAQQMRLTL
ncbi:MAG: GNAT family N-acetyltransferase, partial [Bifidobacteriaceae bacterium]|nr:GNAT family N-acetyltransferase [Bifidobacteriaceae bacterium]